MYGFSVTMSVPFDTAIENVTQALQSEGFGVLSDIDVAGTLKKKLDVDRLPYRILGACNPVFANRALEAEPDIGLLLPCNVVVRQMFDGKIHVSLMDPAAVMQIVDKPEVGELAVEVREMLTRVRDRLSTQSGS